MEHKNKKKEFGGNEEHKEDLALHRLDGEVAQPLPDWEAEMVGDLGNDADDTDEAEQMWRDINRMTSSPELWRRFGPVLRALDRQRYVLAAARIRAHRIAAIEAALAVKSKREREQKKPEPSWQDLWDATERGAELPRKGYEPDTSDPTTPEANPEIADWEAHWPSEDGAHVEPASDTLNSESTEPSIVIVIRGLKRLIFRK